MLTINSIQEFRSKVLHKEEIRENDIGFASTCFCYMISAEGTFDSDWTRECRGITFDNVSGTVNGRSLHKFFNVNERASTQINALDWSKVVRVMDKRDGCCDEHTVLITADGPKSIKEICGTEYFGLVLGWNHLVNEECWTPILAHSVKPNNGDWYEIVLENGETIKLTGNHLVWVKKKSAYVRVDALTLDDEVQVVD
jgi:hypothetical protein